MKRNSKNWYCKRETNLREKNHDKKYRHSPGREKPTDGELSAVHRDVYHTFVERCIVWWPGDMPVVFVHGKSLKSLYRHSWYQMLMFLIFASERTNPRQRRIQWRWQRQKARREVWIGNSSCRQGWVSKKSPVKRSLVTFGKEKFAHSYCCWGNQRCPEI